MAHEPNADDPFQVPPDETAARATLRDEWAEARAHIGLALLTLVPEDDQPRALMLWGRLEQMHAVHDQKLTNAWLTSVQTAYVVGRQEERCAAMLLLDPAPITH